MDDTQKRETFIALRARKEGHEVAADIGYPHLEVPEFQREIVPADQVIRFDPPVTPRPSPPPQIIKNLSVVLLGIIITSACVGFLAFVTR